MFLYYIIKRGGKVGSDNGDALVSGEDSCENGWCNASADTTSIKVKEYHKCWFTWLTNIMKCEWYDRQRPVIMWLN